ncbi:hypothetical protein OESDEN_21317 [Oesophagostomum dentatum]|uniref:Uncharacterized protein n=1 Tax=Oesophagostomum dentatum TaxID=61180 RepID=A0A0B1S591_OESDE|nr:hypothetical protein OESDEN_21317 [Oesophagostomum dentatum]
MIVIKLNMQLKASLVSRPVTVLSTLNMLIVDTSIPNAEPFRRRARSEPTRRKECSQFIRFRSLRETKVERRDRRKPLRVDVVSIASSSESKLRRRRTRRERAQRRLEAQVYIY